MRARRVSAIALAGLVVAGTGLAVTGALPDRLQDGLADALDGIGIGLPRGSVQPPRADAATPVPIDRSGAGTAFRAPRASAPAPAGGSRRTAYDRDYSSYPEYYREYFGLDEEDEDDGYVYVPPPAEAHNPGGPGEPGSPARSEGGGEQPSENDGEHGPAGPAGDPG